MAISLNARVGAVALAICTPLNLFLYLQGPALAPLNYFCWLGAVFGALCFCAEMGGHKPLNRAGLVLLAAAFCAATVSLLTRDPEMLARGQLLFAAATLGALFVWSVALMHRTPMARKAGMAGAAVSGGAIVMLLMAHVLLGTVSVAGFSQLFRALDDPARSAAGALTLIDAIFCCWSLGVSALLWSQRLE